MSALETFTVTTNQLLFCLQKNTVAVSSRLSSTSFLSAAYDWQLTTCGPHACNTSVTCASHGHGEGLSMEGYSFIILTSGPIFLRFFGVVVVFEVGNVL